MLVRAGFSPHSHDGRDLLQILETYPRDELFQTPVAELQSIVTSVLYLQERRRLRLYLRQDEYGRYYSASCTSRATGTPPASGCGSSTS